MKIYISNFFLFINYIMTKYHGIGVEAENSLIYYDDDGIYFNEYNGSHIKSNDYILSNSSEKTNESIYPLLDNDKSYNILTIFDVLPCLSELKYLEDIGELRNFIYNNVVLSSIIDRYIMCIGEKSIKKMFKQIHEKKKEKILLYESIIKKYKEEKDYKPLLQNIKLLKKQCNIFSSYNKKNVGYLIYYNNTKSEPGIVRYRDSMNEIKTIFHKNVLIDDVLNELNLNREFIRQLFISTYSAEQQLEMVGEIEKNVKLDYSPFSSYRFCKYDFNKIHDNDLIFYSSYYNKISFEDDIEYKYNNVQKLMNKYKIPFEKVYDYKIISKKDYENIKKIKKIIKNITSKDHKHTIISEILGSYHINLTIAHTNKEYNEFIKSLHKYGKKVKPEFNKLFPKRWKRINKILGCLDPYYTPTDKVRKTRFYRKHQIWGICIQWIMPLLISVYGCPDSMSINDDHKVSESSFRLPNSTVSYILTSDIKNNGFEGGRKYERTGNRLIELPLTKRPKWIHELYRDLSYVKPFDNYETHWYMENSRMGSDFRRRLPKERFGFELRIHDYFDIKFLGELIQLLFLLADHSLTLNFDDINNPYNNPVINDIVIPVIKEGWNTRISTDYINELNKNLKLNLSGKTSYDVLNNLHTILFNLYKNSDNSSRVGIKKLDKLFNVNRFLWGEKLKLFPNFRKIRLDVINNGMDAIKKHFVEEDIEDAYYAFIDMGIIKK